MYPERYVSQMQDTCGIHAGYMYPQRSSRYMWDTCGIHAGYMYLKCIQREMYLIRRRHVGYMRDTCILSGNQDTIQIHSGSMQDTCGIHAGYVSRGLGECFDAIIVCSTPMRPPIGSLISSGSTPALCSSSIFCFVKATLIPAGLPPWLSAKLSSFS